MQSASSLIIESLTRHHTVQKRFPETFGIFHAFDIACPNMKTTPLKNLKVSWNVLFKASSRPGDTVLDPFSGTFTTCAVAQRLERQAIGIELQEEYIKIGLRRLRIQTEFHGESLYAPRKNYRRKTASAQLSMFDDK